MGNNQDSNVEGVYSYHVIQFCNNESIESKGLGITSAAELDAAENKLESPCISGKHNFMLITEDPEFVRLFKKYIGQFGRFNTFGFIKNKP